ncbi:hypothetical protein ACFLQ1_01660 [Candidatus Auribacterota bacterium]
MDPYYKEQIKEHRKERPYRPGIDPDRRKRPDKLLKSLKWFGVGGWSLLIIAMFCLGLAKPRATTFFDKFYDVHKYDSWNTTTLKFMFFFMIFGLFVSIAGLVVNIKRHHRKNDEYKIYLIILGIISLLGIIQYLVFF